MKKLLAFFSYDCLLVYVTSTKQASSSFLHVSLLDQRQHALTPLPEASEELGALYYLAPRFRRSPSAWAESDWSRSAPGCHTCSSHTNHDR